MPLSHYKYHPWFLRLLYKILQGNKNVLALMGYNPFPDQPPQMLRVVKYRYLFGYVSTDNQIKTNSFMDCFKSNISWWKRENQEILIHSLHLNSKVITQAICDDVWLKH